jgi:hypothetical protein
MAWQRHPVPAGGNNGRLACHIWDAPSLRGFEANRTYVAEDPERQGAQRWQPEGRADIPMIDCADLLRRGLEMEEAMAGHLLTMCRHEALPADLSDAVRRRIAGALDAVHRDTLRHRDAVQDWLTRLENEKRE